MEFRLLRKGACQLMLVFCRDYISLFQGMWERKEPTATTRVKNSCCGDVDRDKQTGIRKFLLLSSWLLVSLQDSLLKEPNREPAGKVEMWFANKMK